MVCEIGWISASIDIGVQLETLETPECVRAETIDPLSCQSLIYSHFYHGTDWRLTTSQQSEDP
jgi:hypothetical protein